MIYLEPEEVVARGQYFDLPCEPEQPLIPRGQHLVALVYVDGPPFAVDVTAPKPYRLVCDLFSTKYTVELYWVDEHELPHCRRRSANEKHPAH
jgi:hypothetical protein